MRWIAVNYLFSPRSQYSYKKESPPHGFERLPSCMPSTAYSTAPTVTSIFEISCEFKSDWVNIGKYMRWIFVRNAVKCGELFFFHRIHRNHCISYTNSPHSPHFLQKCTRKPRPGSQLFHKLLKTFTETAIPCWSQVLPRIEKKIGKICKTGGEKLFFFHRKFRT